MLLSTTVKMMGRDLALIALFGIKTEMQAGMKLLLMGGNLE